MRFKESDEVCQDPLPSKDEDQRDEDDYDDEEYGSQAENSSVHSGDLPNYFDFESMRNDLEEYRQSEMSS